MIQHTPARIEREERDLSSDEMILYLKTYFENHDEGLITLNGLLLLHNPAGIQESSFYVRLASGATVRIRYRLRCKTVFFENVDTGQECEQDQLFSSLETTRDELMNRAYAFVDGEARCFNDIILDLDARAERPIVKTLMQIDGVLTVMFSGERVVAVRDPEKKMPSLTPLQRSMFRNGHVVFEDLKGKYKDDIAGGDQVIPQNTNPLYQGNPDPITADRGTLGHFVSTSLGMEEEEEVTMEGEEEEEEEGGGGGGEGGGEGEEDEEHYAITIGHVL
jgi:hypothetical protein